MIYNSKGQALIEASMILPLALLFFIYLFHVLMYLNVELAIDDALENYLLCEVQKKWDCQKDLKQDLVSLPMSDIQFKTYHRKNLYQIEFSGQVLRFFHIQKSREFKYETQL